MRYCQAVLPKAGLGNRLFPWARCRLFSFQNNVPMLSPTWTQVAVGPLLRGETDLRHYSDLFRVGKNEITGPKKLLVQLHSHKEDEEESALPAANGRQTLKVFAGERDRFLHLNGWHEFLGNELRAITKPRWIAAADKTKDVAIGMHVRMGDFAEGQAEPENPHRRVPHTWFADSLKAIRRVVGYPVRATIVSDGKESELRELLDQEQVTLARTGSAIGDLLLLANSKVLIGSAGSSFSAWAAFLGQMPSIAHPPKAYDWFNLVNDRYYVGGADPDRLPEVFIEQVRTIVGKA